MTEPKSERELFEAWALPEGYDTRWVIYPERSYGSCYMEEATTDARNGWDAGRAALRAVVAPLEVSGDRLRQDALVLVDRLRTAGFVEALYNDGEFSKTDVGSWMQTAAQYLAALSVYPVGVKA